jgi:hypothetical protein
MTPAQLHALAAVHARIHNGTPDGRPAPSRGTPADLLALASLRRG